MERVRLVGGSRDGETALIENGLGQVLIYPPLPIADVSAEEVVAEAVGVQCPPAEEYRRSSTEPGVFRYVPDDLGFVDRCEGGPGRTSIKKSHRAEGRNFVD